MTAIEPKRFGVDKLKKSAMVQQRKAEVLITIIREFLGTTFNRILVVGCGSGLEAVDLAEAFKSDYTIV